jgi:hypothetical protein
MFHRYTAGLICAIIGVAVAVALFKGPNTRTSGFTQAPAPSPWTRIDPDGPWVAFDPVHRVACYVLSNDGKHAVSNVSCVYIPPIPPAGDRP